MFKKINTIAAAIIFIFFLIFLQQPSQHLKNNNKENVLPAQTSKTRNEITLEHNSSFVKVWWVEVTDIDKLTLLANFDKKLKSELVKTQNNCQLLVSAGFYDKSEKPIGLFITEGKTLNKWQTNKILNAVLSVNSMAIPRITRTPPKDLLRIGLQSGPLLIENSQPLEPFLLEDKNARRVVAFTTGENKLYFAIFFDPTSLYSGPYLKDMAKLVQKFSEKINIKIADALNLDGGAASSFYADSLKLTEITTVGSFFCMQK